MRPSLLSLALLSLELDRAAIPEPGLVLWLQALTQVSDTTPTHAYFGSLSYTVYSCNALLPCKLLMK